MKKRLLLCSLVGMSMACHQEDDVQPNISLAAEVVGIYRTNVYLDPSCVAIPAGQMPYAELKAESDSSVTLLYTKPYPTKTSQSFEHIRLRRQTDGSIQFRLDKSIIGALQFDRIFTNNGMEKQGRLLRISQPADQLNFVSFSGFR